nr:MAG TPA: hypothetical protein [Caudoviricetes sp.]
MTGEGLARNSCDLRRRRRAPRGNDTTTTGGNRHGSITDQTAP